MARDRALGARGAVEAKGAVNGPEAGRGRERRPRGAAGAQRVAEALSPVRHMMAQRRGQSQCRVRHGVSSGAVAHLTTRFREGVRHSTGSPRGVRLPKVRLVLRPRAIESAATAKGGALSEPGGEVTVLLQRIRSGDPAAAERLLPLVYGELHRLAAGYMRRERQDHTLQPTALIHEAYLRLAKEDLDWQNREHFIGVAAGVMRHVLVDYARAHNAASRGGGLRRIELADDVAATEQRSDEVLSLDAALEKLAAENPRQARVVELKYFGGLSVEQIAAVMAVAPRTVKRDWAQARAWLFHELQGGAGSGEEA